MFGEYHHQVLGTECVNNSVAIEYVWFVFDSQQPASCQQEMCINLKWCEETWAYGSFRLAEHNQNILNETLYMTYMYIRYRWIGLNPVWTYRPTKVTQPAVAIEKHIPIALCQSWAHAPPVHKGEQMQRTGEELGNVDAKCWPNALAQVLEWNNSCLEKHAAQKQESTNTILDNKQLYEYSIGVLSLCASKPDMNLKAHYVRITTLCQNTTARSTRGVKKTFPQFLGGPPPTWNAILVQSFGQPSPGSSAITLVPCMAFLTLPPMGRCYLWGSHGQGSSDQTRQCRHHQVLLRRTKLELSERPCEKPCVKRIASFPVTNVLLGKLLGVDRRKYVETCRNQIYPNLTISPSTHIYIKILGVLSGWPMNTNPELIISSSWISATSSIPCLLGTHLKKICSSIFSIGCLW